MSIHLFESLPGSILSKTFRSFAIFIKRMLFALSTCPFQSLFLSLTNFAMFVILQSSLNMSFLTLYIVLYLVFLVIDLSIFISVVLVNGFVLLAAARVSDPYTNIGLTIVLYTLVLLFLDVYLFFRTTSFRLSVILTPLPFFVFVL